MWGDFCDAVGTKEPLRPSRLVAIKAYASDLGLTPASRSKVMTAKLKGNAFNGF